MSPQTHDRLFWLLLFGYLAISIAYGVINPLFEAPDEHNHFFVVLHIAETGQLPIVDGSDDDYLQQEAAQPPLYYWLGSKLIEGLELSVTQTGEQLWFNRFVRMGDASSPTNINHFVHAPAEDWPWEGWVAGAQRLRVYSALFGLVTLVGVYQIGRTMWPQKPDRALLAMGLLALLPQFNFLHSYINNDVAVISFATLTLWQLVRVWQTPTPRYAQFVSLGLTIALAMLSKTAGILLLLYAMGFLIVWAWQTGNWRSARNGLATISVLVLLLAGWLLWRNWQLYEDITAANQFVRIAGGDREMSLWGALQETPGIIWSLFGVFGWFNIRAPGWVYAVWLGMIGIATSSSMRNELVRGRTLGAKMWPPNLLPILLAGWVFAVYAGMLFFMLRTPAAQGRLLYPAIAPLVLGLSYGLSKLPPLQRVVWVWWLPALATTLFVLSSTIPNSYRPMSSVPRLPDDAVTVAQSLAPNIELVGYRLTANRFAPNDNVPVELYWRATGNIRTSPDLVLELFDGNTQLIGKLQTLHGGGLHPAELWPPDTLLYSPISVAIEEQVVTPTQAKVSARIVGGEAVDLGFVKVGSAADFVASDSTPLATFGNGITLVSAELSQTTVQSGETVQIDVRWHVTADQLQTLSTLVHLGPTGVAPLAQGDSTPRQGSYPTHWWEAGETFDDQYAVTIPAEMPPGRYPLRIGFYDTAFVRLTVAPDDGDQTFQIGEIVVKEPR